MLTASDLLAGSQLVFKIKIPDKILKPLTEAGLDENSEQVQTVRLKPLTVKDLQRIARAAKESDDLLAAFMVQKSLVEPEMTIRQVLSMHVGLMQYLLQKVNQISGIETTADQISSSLEAPLSKAAFILAREFGWTPQEINELTFGQILLHLQMLQEKIAS